MADRLGSSAARPQPTRSWPTSTRRHPSCWYPPFLGGTHADYAYGVALHGGSAVVAGITYSPDFPTVHAFQPVAPEPPNGFGSKISLTASTPVIAGSTWYTNGTRAASATAGSVVRAYATNALQGVPYLLVLATAGGADVVAVLNPTIVFAGPSGLLGRVEGASGRAYPQGPTPSASGT